MTRLRLFAVLAFSLLMAGCPALEQPQNFISFTWDGVQYLFTASAATEARPWAIDHPYAVGMVPEGEQEVWRYVITGSASPDDAEAGTNTISILIERVENFWDLYVDLHVSTYGYNEFYVSNVPDSMLDTFLANRDAVGEQVAGSLPGPLQGETPVLENILFSVERLPDQTYELPS